MKNILIQIPVRIRAALVLLALLLLCWVPAVIAVERMWKADGLTVQEVYGEWMTLVKDMIKRLTSAA